MAVALLKIAVLTCRDKVESLVCAILRHWYAVVNLQYYVWCFRRQDARNHATLTIVTHALARQESGVISSLPLDDLRQTRK
jgi:hypothetical protein